MDTISAGDLERIFREQMDVLCLLRSRQLRDMKDTDFGSKNRRNLFLVGGFGSSSYIPRPPTAPNGKRFAAEEAMEQTAERVIESECSGNSLSEPRLAVSECCLQQPSVADRRGIALAKRQGIG